MAASGEKGSIVSILCDSGERYASTYFNDAWLADQGLTCPEEELRMQRFLGEGVY
jgi:cysteine synthase A